MESEGVSLPLFHHHRMIPCNDLRKGDCCERCEDNSDGYYCKSCDYFVHKRCGESSESIELPSHPNHTLWLRSSFGSYYCDLCGRVIQGLFYRCDLCDFDVDLYCAKDPPQEVIDSSEMHHHKLTLVKEKMEFYCYAMCGKIGGGFLYKCQECDLSFHVYCVWPPPEVNHPPEVKHTVHSRKLVTDQPPTKIAGGSLRSSQIPPDGKCYLCGEEIDGKSLNLCSSCNSTFHSLTVKEEKKKNKITLDSFKFHILFFFFYLFLLLLFFSPFIIVYLLFFYLLLLVLFLAFLFLLLFLLRQLVTMIMEAKGVSLPLFHHHRMMPWHDLRKGDCCGRFETICDGYYCKICNFFVHKKCGDESYESIEHPSHSMHTLWFQQGRCTCSLCGRIIMGRHYHCKICDFNVDIYCARYPPPEVIDISETHHHKLTLLKKRIEFHCDAKCGKIVKEFPYICQECDLSFHVDCVWNPSEVNLPLEVNHSYHSLHPLKLLKGQPPDYSDGTCRLCKTKNDDEPFYHCSSCNFTLDMRCVLNPPLQSLLDLKAHDHQLTLFPRLDSFKCDACGLKGDRSPYICVPCDFMIHQDCLGLPRLININRHDHRVSRTSVLGVVNSVCGVCHQEVDWTCGGYSCQQCPGYVVHSKCATRDDVWNGEELEGIPEETEDIEPYVVIDDNKIQHFSHKGHHLRLHVNGVQYEANKRCRACTHPISLQSFYGCINCDFILHKDCAEFPRKKWHVLHNERLTLVTSTTQFFVCVACRRMSSGFAYQHGSQKFDVLCGSISEPFVHPSHPHHPLYYTSPGGEKICNGCNMLGFRMLSCIEIGCEFVLCFECATLPQVVKHRVSDHPLSLAYGEKEIGIYWCDICEKKTDPKKWFYTCEDRRAVLHTECVLGCFLGIMPGKEIELWGRSYELVLNRSVSRPFCWKCKLHCMHPMMLKMLGTSDTYICSFSCTEVHKQSKERISLVNGEKDTSLQPTNEIY